MTASLLTKYEDQVVGGIHKLGKLIHRSPESAVYETEYGDNAKSAVIKLRRGDTPEAERWLARWRSALELSHPNLIRLYGAGRSMLDELPVVYVVMERADESLGGVLAERALSGDETREMLEPTLAALGYLHKSGYAHSSVRAANIMAVGDGLKLSGDSAEAAEAGGAPAEDMWGLGEVLVQALTHQLPKIEEDGGPYILRDAPEPFTDIVRHCLDPDADKRWTVDQVALCLNPQAAAVAAKPVIQALPVQKETVRAAPDPPRVTPRLPMAERAATTEEEVPGSNNRKWIYGALAGVIGIGLVIGASLGLTKKTYRAPPVNETAIATPEVVTKAPPPLQTPAPAQSPPAAKSIQGQGWVVVVASYGSRGPAEKRVRDMSRRWSKFKVEIFEPPSEKARHLVVIGKDLSQPEAEALRKRAVSSGLPRDTYIKRLL